MKEKCEHCLHHCGTDEYGVAIEYYSCELKNKLDSEYFTKYYSSLDNEVLVGECKYYLCDTCAYKDILEIFENLHKELEEKNEEIEKLKEEKEYLKNIINNAIDYNKKICKIYDCGIEKSNAETNILLLTNNLKEEE